jgi:adenosine deaminase
MHNRISRTDRTIQDIAALRELLHGLPKIDLHRHLEGSLRLQTLAEIALQHGIDLPAYSIEELRPYVQVTSEESDFHRFLAKFQLLRRFYRTQEAVERITHEAVADAAADNIRYLELRFNPVALARNQNFPLNDVTEWVCNTIERAQQEYNITVRLILQIGRDESLRVAEEIVDLACAYRGHGVVGIDLAGDEVNYPPHRFGPLFSSARQEGLGITVHAGEAGGAENVQAAIELLHASRIGHGVRLVESDAVTQLAREQGAVLEVCPTSNLQTGVVRSFGQHPLPRLFSLGLRVTINTDDPSVSDTTLTDEYLVAIVAIGATLDQLRQAVFHATNGTFLPPDERERLNGQFQAWKDELPQVDHLLLR